MSNDPVVGLGSFTDKLALGEAQRGSNKKRVIVTGGSGKLGRATVKYLADEGWEVISVDTRRPPTASEDGKSGLGGAYRLVEIDLTDMGAVLETVRTLSIVSSLRRQELICHPVHDDRHGIQWHRCRCPPCCHPVSGSDEQQSPVWNEHYEHVQRP